MSDIKYSIEVAFLQSGGFNAPAAGLDTLHAKVNSIHGSMLGMAGSFANSFNGAIDSIGSSIIGLGATAAAAIGTTIATGLTLAGHAAFKFNEELENATISIGAIAKANDLVPTMADGLRLSAEMMKDMRKDAARLPGEFADLTNIMSTVTSAGAQSGMGLPAIEKMSAKVMAVAATLRVPMDVAAREMAMMLEGNARHQMPFFNRLGVGSPKDFNKLTTKERRDKALEALDKFSPAIDQWTHSWMGIRTTAVDSIRQMAGAMGGVMFSKAKSFGERFNKWITEGDGINWAEGIGVKIGEAFDKGVAGILHWYPIIKTFTMTMYDGISGVIHRLEPVFKRLFGGLEKFLQDPKAFDKIASALGTVAALRVGSGVLGSGLSSAASMVPAVGGFAAMGTAALLAAPAIIGLAMAAEGIAVMVTDTLNPLLDFATSQMRHIGENAEELGKSLEFLRKGAQPGMDQLGAELLLAVRGSVAALDLFVTGVAAAYELMRDYTQRFVGMFMHGGLNGSAAQDAESAALLHEERSNRLHVRGMAWLDAKAEPNREPKIENHSTHFHGPITIQIQGDADPNRVARRTVDMLEDFARHPKTAQRMGSSSMSL